MACPAPHRASLFPLPAPPQDRAGLDPCLSFPSEHQAWKASAPATPGKGVQGARSGAGSTRRRRAPAWLAGLYKPGLDEAQAQALLPDSHPEMPREQPRLGYCSTSLLPNPAKEKQQEKPLTSPLPALGPLDGGSPVGRWERGGQTDGQTDGQPIPACAFPSGPGAKPLLPAGMVCPARDSLSGCTAGAAAHVPQRVPSPSSSRCLSWCPPAALACPAKAA